MHAEQLSLMGASVLAASHGALSADHLEFLDETGVIALRDAGTVAVLLPGAYYFIRETRLPPMDLLRRHRVPIAIATDSNPGTSPTPSLLLMLNMEIGRAQVCTPVTNDNLCCRILLEKKK